MHVWEHMSADKAYFSSWMRGMPFVTYEPFWCLFKTRTCFVFFLKKRFPVFLSLPALSALYTTFFNFVPSADLMFVSLSQVSHAVLVLCTISQIKAGWILAFADSYRHPTNEPPYTYFSTKSSSRSEYTVAPSFAWHAVILPCNVSVFLAVQSQSVTLLSIVCLTNESRDSPW